SVALALFLLLLLALRRAPARVALSGFALLFAVKAAVFAPEAAFIARHWEYFNTRARTVFIANSDQWKANPRGTAIRQIGRNLTAPWSGPVNDAPQYTPLGEPQLDRPTGALVLLGMLVAVSLPRYRRRPETWLWWLMLLSGWSLTQLLTTGTPN